MAAHIVGRTARQGVVDFKEAYVGIGGMANLVVGTVDAAQTEVHIGLATGHPHLASEDVGHGEAFFAGGDCEGVRSGGADGGEIEAPAAVLTGAHGSLVSGEGSSDLLTLGCPSPNVYGLAALYHHVV